MSLLDLVDFDRRPIAASAVAIFVVTPLIWSVVGSALLLIAYLTHT